MTEIVNELVKWLSYTVVLSLVPVMVGAIASRRGNSLRHVIERGELLLVASTLCATAMGELHTAPPGVANSAIAIAAGGVSMAVVVGGGVVYGRIKGMARSKVASQYNDILAFTSAMFFASLACSASLIILSKGAF
jgi:hypothetical protein